MTSVYPDEVPFMVTECSRVVGIDGNATFNFTMPSATYGDAPLSGALEYEILVDGVLVKRGEAEAGMAVEQKDIRLDNGNRVISIRACNSSGAGPEYIIREFVGFDQPEKVGNIVAVRAQEGIHVSWDAVETGVHSLPVDVENIRYSVIRMPAGVEVASDVKETEWTDISAVTEASLVHYEVIATDGMYVSDPAQSNSVVMGEALTLPFAYDFRNKPGLGLFTTIDNNSDGASWIFRDKYGILCMPSSVAADDWLITPPLKLSKGIKYKLTASLGVGMDPERFEIRYGKGAQVGDMTLTAVEPTLIDMDNAFYRDVWNEPGNIVAEITPEEDGEYNFAVHAISDPGALFLYCCDMALEASGESAVETVGMESGEIYVATGSDGVTVSGVSGIVEVYTVSGIKVAQHMLTDAQPVEMPLAKGFYIVKAGGNAVKIMIR